MSQNTTSNDYSPERTGVENVPRRGSRRYLLPVIVLALAAIGAFTLLNTKPSAKRTPPKRQAKLVQVERIHLADRSTMVAAMGTVVPARETRLAPRVNGQIEAVSDEYAPGGYFRAGDEVLRLDASDYELLVRQRQAAVDQASSAYEIELGQQAVARREFELLGEGATDGDRALMLRQPQLVAAEASLAAARAALEDARMDLGRTRVRAPYNAVLADKLADVGTQVSTASAVGTLIGTDVFWVEVSVPVDQLRWIQIPSESAQTGAKVKVFDEAAWGSGTHRAGEVIRLRPELEEQGRMARLVIAVHDPLALQPQHQGQPRLILSTYVRVEIDGLRLADVATVSRDALRDDDTVYLMGADGGLEIRPIDVVFRTGDAVYARGLIRGERLVTTDLSAPVQGMPLRLGESASQPQQGDQEGRS